MNIYYILAFFGGIIVGLLPAVVLAMVVAWHIKQPDKDWQDRRAAK